MVNIEGPLQKWLTLLIPLLFIGPVQMIFAPFSGPASGQTEPPASGDWVIWDNTVKSSTTITMTGNITVKPGGFLTLDHIDLRFNSSNIAEYRFVIEKGGNLTMSNCTVMPVDNTYGFSLDIYGDALVRDSVFSYGGRYLDPRAIRVNSDNVLITNNHFDHSNNTAISINPGASPRIYNNTMIGGAIGVAINDNHVGLPPNMPVLYNNTISDVSDNGIFIGDTTRPYILGNRIDNPGNRGIHIQFTNAVVTWNTITNAKNEAGIFLFGGSNRPNAYIANNTIENCVYGFTSSGLSDSIFENNTIINSEDAAMILQFNTNIKIWDNVIRGTKSYGMIIRENADPWIENNDLFNNWYGIRLDSRGKGTIINNLIKGGKYGVNSRLSSPEIIDNKFIHQSASSILIDDKHYSKIPVINGNTISHADFGIVVKDSNLTISENDISNTNSSGIELRRNAVPEIFYNNITFNKRSGLTLQNGSWPNIHDNMISDNMYGISMNDADITLKDNLFSFNEFAVNCDNGDNSVFINNTFLASELFDFVVRHGSHPIVRSSPINKSRVTADMSSSLLVEWMVRVNVINSQGTPIVDAVLNLHNKDSDFIHYDRSEIGGRVPTFRTLEAEIEFDGVHDFGPFTFEVQKNGETNTTEMDIDKDIEQDLYLNYKPVLFINELLVEEDRDYILDLNDYLDDDDGNIEDLVITTNDPGNITIENDTKIMTIHYSRDINYKIVTFNISDGISSLYQDVILQVTPFNDRPTFTGTIPNFEVYEDIGWSLNLTEYFDDEERSEGLLFTSTHPEIDIDNDTKTASWSASTEDVGGLEFVVFRALDMMDLSLYIESNPFDLDLVPVNDRPVYLGGMENATVIEDLRWDIWLRTFFDDEENRIGLNFTSSDPRINITDDMHAVWTPEEGDTSIVGLTFRAYDAEDERLFAVSEPITLTFQAVDDPPVFRKVCLEGVSTTIYQGQIWQLVLTDCFFDEERDPLVYEANFGASRNFKIVNDSLGRVKAVWNPQGGSEQTITNLLLYAYQNEGDAKGRRALSPMINLTFKPNQTTGPQKPPTTIYITEIPTWVYVLIPVAIIGTAVAFYTYRRVKYHKYRIQDIFLIFNDGRLITHMTGEGKISEIDEDILASMLTAIQDFVKDSLSSREVSSLDEMKYGDMKILIERGIFAYLSVVISGNVTEKLKDDLKEVLRNVERKYATILEAWDGDNRKLKNMKHEIKKLIEKQPENILDLLRSY